jgi:hypothetical protein
MTTGKSSGVVVAGTGVLLPVALCPNASGNALVMSRTKTRAGERFMKNLKDKLVNLTEADPFKS